MRNPSGMTTHYIMCYIERQLGTRMLLPAYGAVQADGTRCRVAAQWLSRRWLADDCERGSEWQ